MTSGGMSALATLKKLEVLNLTETAVDDSGTAALLKTIPTLKRLWLFGSKATSDAAPAKLVVR